LQEFLNIQYPSQEAKKQVKEIIIGYSSFEDTIPKRQSKLLQGNQLNLTEYPNLEKVIINGKYLKSKLTELNVSGCAKLIELYCNDNQLTNLDLSGCFNLEALNCSENQLTNLDFLNGLNPEGLI